MEYNQPIRDTAGEAPLGNVSLTDALTHSINSVYAQLGWELCGGRSHCHALVNQMERWRKQIEDHVTANAAKPAIVKPLKDLDKAIWEVEVKLVSRSEVHSDDKYFPEAYKVYMNLIWLSGGVGQGASDEAGSIDYKPTDTQLQVLDVIEKELASAKAGFDKLQATDIPAFNKAMAGKVPPIVQ